MSWLSTTQPTVIDRQRHREYCSLFLSNGYLDNKSVQMYYFTFVTKNKNYFCTFVKDYVSSSRWLILMNVNRKYMEILSKISNPRFKP